MHRAPLSALRHLGGAGHTYPESRDRAPGAPEAAGGALESPTPRRGKDLALLLVDRHDIGLGLPHEINVVVCR